MKISDFQNLIKELYFHKDSIRGLKNTFIWLIEEVGELASIIKKEERNKEEASEEIADIIAWTVSIANILNIDIEKALNKKYPNICIKCNEKPCCCQNL